MYNFTIDAVQLAQSLLQYIDGPMHRYTTISNTVLPIPPLISITSMQICGITGTTIVHTAKGFASNRSYRHRLRDCKAKAVISFQRLCQLCNKQTPIFGRPSHRLMVRLSLLLFNKHFFHLKSKLRPNHVN